MLTKKQKELYDFLCAEISGCGISPSFEEMRQDTSTKSKSGVHRLILGLEERGFIRRIPFHNRAIEIVSDRHPVKPKSIPALRKARKVVRAAGKLETRYHNHMLTVTEKSLGKLRQALKEYHAN